MVTTYFYVFSLTYYNVCPYTLQYAYRNLAEGKCIFTGNCRTVTISQKKTKHKTTIDNVEKGRMQPKTNIFMVFGVNTQQTKVASDALE